MADQYSTRVKGFPARPRSPIERATHSAPTTVQHVRVDHRRRHVPVPEQLLNGADVVPVLEQVRRERVPQRVATRPLHSRTSTPTSASTRPRDAPTHWSLRRVRARMGGEPVAWRARPRAVPPAACQSLAAHASRRGCRGRTSVPAQSAYCFRYLTTECVRAPPRLVTARVSTTIVSPASSRRRVS